MLPMTCSRFRSLMAVCAASAIASAAPPAAAITMDMVTVGDAGNAADTTGYGVVTYRYGIGKYEVTIEQYAEFLNAVAATDTNKFTWLISLQRGWPIRRYTDTPGNGSKQAYHLRLLVRRCAVR